MASTSVAKPASTTHSLTVTSADQPAPSVIALGHSNVLTVGAGMEFATLGDALKAAPANATIAVEAGTYTNDFGTISQNVTIVAVGGLVHEVATVPPPDDKGILTVDANLDITGFTFTGGTDHSPDGNVAGIRLETGNLSVNYCEFSDMQEGLLANPDATATVTINHSLFMDNGTGDGYTHNLYVGAVKSLVVENSVFEGANVGHEIKSRAATTTIDNNVIVDGATGTGSYDIDVPNGGVANIYDNIIEKGPNASNEVAIHYGGETQYAYTQNSLDVWDNTIINDLPATVQSWAVDNQSAVNGLNVVAQIHDNALWNYSGVYQSVSLGAANVYDNTQPATEPGYSTTSPLGGLPQIVLGQGPQILSLTTGNHTITGGGSQMIVGDAAGSNTIKGGAGGLTVSANAGWDSITTASGAQDTVNLPGRNSVLMSYGTDHINASGTYEQIETFGHATINATGFNSYDLNGTGEVLNVANGAILQVGAGAQATVNDTYGDTLLTMHAGGTIVATDSAAAHGGLPNAVATISGALTGTIGNSGTITLATGATGASITGGAGAMSVTGGTGNDTLVATGGTDHFVLGGGTDRVVLDGGNVSVTAGSGVDHFVIEGGGDGTYTITGYQPGTDTLNFPNFSVYPISSGSVVNGNTILDLADGSTLDLVGVALKGYPDAGSASVSGGNGGGHGGSSSQPGTATSSNGTLLTQGNVVTGGAKLLTLVDAAGGNTIHGGAGGMDVTTAYTDVLSTQAGSADTVNLSCYDTLTGAGADTVSASGYRNQITESATASVTLQGASNLVKGGAGKLTVADNLGGNTVIGGAGGLNLTLAGSYEVVTTAGGASDSVSLGGYSQVLSQGHDQITLSGVDNTATVTGGATISAAGWASFVLNGNETLNDTGGFVATVGSGAAKIVSSGSGGQATVAASASLSLSQTYGSGGLASVTVTGGSAICNNQGSGWAGVTVNGGSATNVLAGGGPIVVNSLGGQGQAGVCLSAGSGNITLNGGAGNDSFKGGSGQAQLNLGGGADTVTFGTGAVTVNAGGADLFVVTPSSAGTAMIVNWSSGDTISGASPVSQTVTGGSTLLTYQGGLQIELVGVSHNS